MLILMRRPRERLYIGDDIIIELVHVEDGRVRIGIQAPKSVPVHREEIYAKIQRQGQEPAPGEDAPRRRFGLFRR